MICRNILHSFAFLPHYFVSMFHVPLREKNERIIGKKIQKYFGVTTWPEVEKQLSDQTVTEQNPTDSETQQLLAELRHIANDMEFNGKFWRVNELSKLTQTLSLLRDDKGEG